MVLDLDADERTDILAGSLAIFFNGRASPVSEDTDSDGIPDECERARFRRGDCDGDGAVGGNVTDAIHLLNFNFLGGLAPPCAAACDANADGAVFGSVTDAVYILTFSFLGGPAPPAPSPDCGPGRESDEALGCAQPPRDCALGG
jgi:hypothetical protein